MIWIKRIQKLSVSKGFVADNSKHQEIMIKMCRHNIPILFDFWKYSIRVFGTRENNKVRNIVVVNLLNRVLNKLL